MKLIVILLLGLGLIPVVTIPFDTKASASDSTEVLKYKMIMRNVTPGQIARALKISESNVHCNLNKKRTYALNEIVKQINRIKIK